jgi:hypothetical protein
MALTAQGTEYYCDWTVYTSAMIPSTSALKPDGQPVDILHDFYIPALRRAVLAVCDQDPLCWGFIQQAVIDGRTRLPVRQWLEQGRLPRGLDMPGLLRLIFAAAPLSRVMLRHTWPLLEIYRSEGQLGANLAQRYILPIRA